ncbi:MAG: helix-turn-helix domain-containing protein [Planctomycetota bacterium]|nr:MAG: helix-turn-helix domain-containing protein [Planctomycetota bacterium]
MYELTDGRVLLSVSETARAMGVSDRMVWRLIAEGEIRAIKIGRCTRVPCAELERIADSGREVTREG